MFLYFLIRIKLLEFFELNCLACYAKKTCLKSRYFVLIYKSENYAKKIGL